MKLVNGLAPSWIEYEGARFQVKPLTQLGLIDVQNEIQRRGAKVTMSARGIELILDDCLIAWEGITGDDDAPTPMSSAAKRALPVPAMVHIAGQVYRLSALTEDQRKNS